MSKHNTDLAGEIVRGGSLLVSEYPPGYPVNSYNYSERDRIQSLLSESVFVIQSENNGGTMICVKRSLKDKKTVCALKGNNLTLITRYIDSSDTSLLFK